MNGIVPDQILPWEKKPSWKTDAKKLSRVKQWWILTPATMWRCLFKGLIQMHALLSHNEFTIPSTIKKNRKAKVNLNSA